MEIRIAVPQNFSFKRTALSHGWYGLLPFELDQDEWKLVRVLKPFSDTPITVIVSSARDSLQVSLGGRPNKRVVEAVVRDVRHVFRLDDDLRGFYSAVRGEPDFAWIARQGAGRLLRSPTVFEDVVKSICTTNCSWALTKKMVTGLVNNLGIEAKDGRRAFPTQLAMAAAPVQFYRDEVRAGYRAPYLKELAERVASGEIDVESWLASELPTDELKREMKRIKGVGDYAAENLLKLVGRYDCLALDSWVRAKFARTHGGGKATGDEKIARYYSRFRSWRGLALWCDMTRDWLE
jgi:3-methyladenine DNA glycosylase/8-oxoguanine DNA glycosylase